MVFLIYSPFYVSPSSKITDITKPSPNINATKGSLIFSSINLEIQKQETSFGYDVIIPGGKSSFSSFPNISFQIEDGDLWKQYTHQYRYSSEENTTIPWKTFNPLNTGPLLAEMALFWENTPESMPISLDFQILDKVVNPYRIQLYKDLTKPSFQMGYELDSEGNLISHDSLSECFQVSPILYLNITDNVPVLITVYLSINNHLYSFDRYPTVVTSTSSSSQLAQIMIPDWDELDEGENEFILYAEDTAKNPSNSQILSFIKDTTAPVLNSGDESTAWFQINGVLFTSLFNPVYETYVIETRPTFTFTLVDRDVATVRLYFNLTEINYPLESQIDATNLSYGSVYLDASNRSEGEWVIEFPNRVWNAMEADSLTLKLVVSDNANNTNSYIFVIEQASNYGEGNGELVREIFVVLTIILSLSGIMSGISYHYSNRRLRRHPFEQDLTNLDSDLLDVILQPVNREKTAQIMKIAKQSGDRFSIEDITQPDLKKFLKTSLQLVDLNLIKSLIRDYPMEPLEREEFLREMMALKPEERQDFLQTFMNNQHSNNKVDVWEDDNDDDDEIGLPDDSYTS